MTTTDSYERLPHQFIGHADAPATWCVVPDTSTEHGYCGQPEDAAIHVDGRADDDEIYPK